MSVAAAGDSCEQIADSLSAYLSAQLGKPSKVHGLTRLTGGSSNETWAFDLQPDNGNAPSIPLVLRRCFESGPLEVRLEVEFHLLKALHRLGLPVPRPWACVIEASPLQSPFMIVSRAPGTDARKLLAQNAAPSSRRQMGDELVAVLARLHAVDWQRELGNFLTPVLGRVALHEVERWAPDIEADSPRSPLLLATLDWLRANAPADARLCLVHGDFKTNNLLFDDGRTQAVIDWELAHIGDPLEDLAWTMLWNTEYDLVNGLLAPPVFLASYAAASGTEIDARRLFFWRMFSLFKLAAIFIRGLKTATPEVPARPMLIQLVRALPYLEQKLAELLITALDEEDTSR